MWSRERPVYRGIPMRSRVEVRWAEFFDAHDLAWEYEPLRFRRYTPDFGLRDKRIFVEVKGKGLPVHNKITYCNFPFILAMGDPGREDVICKTTWDVGMHRAKDFISAFRELSDWMDSGRALLAHTCPGVNCTICAWSMYNSR